MICNGISFPQDHSGGKYLILTLRELKGIVNKTASRRRPSARHLRQHDSLLVRKAMDDCCLEVYASGFILYLSECCATVMRIEEICNRIGDNLDNTDWSVGIRRSGEERVAAGMVDNSLTW